MNNVTATDNLLEIRGLKKHFSVGGGLLHAVDDVSLAIPRGKTLGLVGESGCGKSTLGRVVIGLIEATAGEVFFNGKDSLKFNSRERSEFRRHAQIVFQDPFSPQIKDLVVERVKIQGFVGKREVRRFYGLFDFKRAAMMQDRLSFHWFDPDPPARHTQPVGAV